MRRYTLAQLEALRSVVTCGSFQAAADQLNVTQPTISLRIRELESIVGAPLMRRSGRRGELTAEGVVLYQHAERMASTLDEMDRRLRTREPVKGLLRIGSSDTFAISCLPDLLTRMDQLYPELRVELTIDRSTKLADLLSARQLDIAFMVETPLESDMRVHPMAYCRMAWFGPEERGRYSTPLTAADLAQRRVMALPVDSPLHNLMVRWFEDAHQPLPAFDACNSLAIILRLIDAGHAWSILPECFSLSNEGNEARKQLVVVPELPMLKLCVAYRANSNAHTLVSVVDLCRDVLQGKPGLLPLA